jgi:hypothetical protein
MSGKFRFEIPDQRKPAPRPPRRRERDKQSIPKAADTFAWAPGELLIGQPRADRKARKQDDNV